MNVEKLQGWLAILANIGVIAGLLLLVAEIDQANEQASSATYQNRIDQIDLSLQALAANEYLPEIYVKLEQNGISELTPGDLFRLRAWETARSLRIIGQLNQYERGFLDEYSYSTAIRAFTRNVSLWKQLGIAVDDPALVRVIEIGTQN